MAVATCQKIASRVNFLSLSVRVARGMASADRKASYVRAPKNASRMIRNAQASETMSSVRATEQLRSRRRVGAAPEGARDASLSTSAFRRTGLAATLATAVRAISCLFACKARRRSHRACSAINTNEIDLTRKIRSSYASHNHAEHCRVATWIREVRMEGARQTALAIPLATIIGLGLAHAGGFPTTW